MIWEDLRDAWRIFGGILLLQKAKEEPKKHQGKANENVGKLLFSYMFLYFPKFSSVGILWCFWPDAHLEFRPLQLDIQVLCFDEESEIAVKYVWNIRIDKKTYRGQDLKYWSVVISLSIMHRPNTSSGVPSKEDVNKPGRHLLQFNHLPACMADCLPK